jgi:predicted nucleic acid-binding protein
VVIPPAVYDEVVIRGKGKPGAREIETATWIEVKEPGNKKEVEILKSRFGSG